MAMKLSFSSSWQRRAASLYCAVFMVFAVAAPASAERIEAARRAWAKTKELMADPSIRLVVLDELNIALRYDHLDIGEVTAALKARRPDLHVVVTGRNAKPELIEAADLVTEMRRAGEAPRVASWRSRSHSFVNVSKAARWEASASALAASSPAHRVNMDECSTASSA